MSLSLTAGVAYTFQIIATNAVGTAVIGTTTAVIPFSTPGAPTLGTVTPGDKTASLPVTVNSNGNAITNYEYATSTTNIAPTSFTQLGTTSPLTIPLPTNGTLYYIWIRAVNSAGPGPISSTTATGLYPFIITSVKYFLGDTASLNKLSFIISTTYPPGITAFSSCYATGSISNTNITNKLTNSVITNISPTAISFNPNTVNSGASLVGRSIIVRLTGTRGSYTATSSEYNGVIV
jgi:hypothetical protein